MVYKNWSLVIFSSYYYRYALNNPLKYADPSGYKIGILAQTASGIQDDIGPAGSTGGGISWPRYGTLHSPRNDFEYDMMMANALSQYGFTDGYQEIKWNLQTGNYNRSLKYRWEQVYINPNLNPDPNDRDYIISEVSTAMRKVWYYNARSVWNDPSTFNGGTITFIYRLGFTYQKETNLLGFGFETFEFTPYARFISATLRETGRFKFETGGISSLKYGVSIANISGNFYWNRPYNKLDLRIHIGTVDIVPFGETKLIFNPFSFGRSINFYNSIETELNVPLINI
ncbi:hypothetical protein GF312_11805 [Candidatus Poribacteria bacterium]|nr:hypothetical protein [Candidatus Poribacteria bacterium]